MNNDYLTVSQVANIVGITTQAIYKQLHNQLQPFVVKVGNKTMLKKTVVIEFYNKELPTKFATVTNQTQSSLQPLPTKTNQVIESLNEQLKTKDQQINDLLSKQDKLQDELNKQNEHNRKQSDKLITLVEQVNELQRNNQVLLAQSQHKQISSETDEDAHVNTKKHWWNRKK